MSETIGSLTEMKYEGFDVSLETSVFEYGFIFSESDPRSEGDIRFMYSIGNNKFDWADFKPDLDFWDEFNWVSEEDKLSVCSFIGCELNDFNALPLQDKIHALYSYFGYQNVFGESYHGGFSISE